MKTPLAIAKEFDQDNLAEFIGNTWFTYHSNRRPVIEAWKELRNFIFATDTRTTSNSKLPWKNSTTLPKLCQIRDNLHSNYISALFPHDDWLKWEAYSRDSFVKEKREAITAYMSNKLRVSDFRAVVDQLVYDYIDYGNCFATVTFESSYSVDALGQKVPTYIGPRLYRISPLDIVFNPTASSFEDSFKIIRSIKTIGELVNMSEEQADQKSLRKALRNRKRLLEYAGRHSIEDLDKAEAYQIDGFGNYSDYLQSEFVEVLDFYGDVYNSNTGKLEKGRHIRIIDRMWTISNDAIPSWHGVAPIFHVGWRRRPDNLWAMGPLENLVGMQYRIDHLENSKADAYDLAIHPPLKIKGDVEAFEWGPKATIHLDENGDVEEIVKNIQWVINADNQIAQLEQRMEMFAGAPKEAMGVRSPGEKTAFEVQRLENAAGRIFQEKVNTFEVEFLEKALNFMLETARRNLDSEDIIRVMDDDLAVEKFITITKADIVGSGKLRPVGSRHFAAKAQLVQNLTNISNTRIWEQIAPHMSSVSMAALVEDVFELARYTLFKPNQGVHEAADTQRTLNTVNEDLTMEATMGVPQ